MSAAVREDYFKGGVMSNYPKWNGEPQLFEDLGVWFIYLFMYSYKYFCYDSGIKCDVIEKAQILVSGQPVFELWLYLLLAVQTVT